MLRRISLYTSDNILSLSSSHLSVFSTVNLSAEVWVSRIMLLLNPARVGANTIQWSHPTDKRHFLQVHSFIFLRSLNLDKRFGTDCVRWASDILAEVCQELLVLNLCFLRCHGRHTSEQILLWLLPCN